jgi:hypothetical protein
MDKGQQVEVKEYGGNLLIRRVVADRGQTIVVCTEEEFLAALKEKRNPDGVGFPRSSVKTLTLSRQG